MKRYLFICMLIAIAFGMVAGIVSCTRCGKGEPGEPNVIQDTLLVESDYDGVLPEGKLVFEHVVSTHRQQMFNLLGNGNYTWYESHAVLMRDINEAEDCTIKDITSVFSVFSEEGGSYVQYITTNWERGTWIPEPIPGLWIEDNSLNDDAIKITLEAAFQKLMESNCTKPHDKNVTLRNPVGPKKCNAQYVFGNILETVFVDAVTGEVRTSNPAFE